MPPDARTTHLAARAAPIPDNPGFWCTELDDHLVKSLIERTHDPSDVRLREMTRDLVRFSSAGKLDKWRPGRDLLCLQDDEGTLLGISWLADKPLPQRDDYLDPELMRRHDPRVTCAIRTYGEARGRGLLTIAFAKYSLERLLRNRPEQSIVWYETKAHNSGARALAAQLGFLEVSGEAGGSVVGIRLPE